MLEGKKDATYLIIVTKVMTGKFLPIPALLCTCAYLMQCNSPMVPYMYRHNRYARSITRGNVAVMDSDLPAPTAGIRENSDPDHVTLRSQDSPVLVP